MMALDSCHLYIAAQRTEQGTPAGVGIMTPGQEDLVGNTGGRGLGAATQLPATSRHQHRGTDIGGQEVKLRLHATFDYRNDFEVRSGSHRHRAVLDCCISSP